MKVKNIGWMLTLMLAGTIFYLQADGEETGSEYDQPLEGWPNPSGVDVSGGEGHEGGEPEKGLGAQAVGLMLEAGRKHVAPLLRRAAASVKENVGPLLRSAATGAQERAGQAYDWSKEKLGKAWDATKTKAKEFKANPPTLESLRTKAANFNLKNYIQQKWAGFNKFKEETVDPNIEAAIDDSQESILNALLKLNQFGESTVGNVERLKLTRIVTAFKKNIENLEKEIENNAKAKQNIATIRAYKARLKAREAAEAKAQAEVQAATTI